MLLVRPWIAAFAAFACLAAPSPSPAKSVAPEPFARHADFADVQLSPSGKLLAAIAPIKGRRGIVVMDVATRKAHVAASLSDSDVRSFDWVNDGRLVFDLIDLQSGLGEQRRSGGLFAVDADGQNFRVLSQPPHSQMSRGQMIYRYTRLARTLRDGTSDILALSNDRNYEYENLYRLDTRDGRRTLLSDRLPGDPVRWVADAKGIARAVVTSDRRGTTKSWWRSGEDAEWKLIGEHGLRDAKVLPVEFDADGSLIVASDVGRDTFALFRYDTNRMALGELLAGHPYADLTDVILSGSQHRILGVRYDDGKPGVAWFDETWAKLAALVNRALPSRFNELSGTPDRVLVTSVSDTDPGSWYLLDPATRKLEFLLAARKDVRPETMPRRETLRYRARDGLTVPGIVTLPRDREPRNLPLIVLVHGGPYVRGAVQWNWRGEPAFLASLGYAVLEPDFRGSLGWGRKHFQAGWKQWGLAMQDDLVDGIDWLAAKGTVDPKRVCIMGGSYGGYAVMMGLARDPDRFRCGINIVGVTDIDLLFSVTWSDLAYSDFLKHDAKELIGDPERDAAKFKATSPLANAAKIRVPVLMAYGGLDYRVPIVHGERMYDALRANGTPAQWIVYQDEGHGFILEKNRFDFFQNIADFLTKHLPPD